MAHFFFFFSCQSINILRVIVYYSIDVLKQQIFHREDKNLHYTKWTLLFPEINRYLFNIYEIHILNCSLFLFYDLMDGRTDHSFSIKHLLICYLL
jgi:hypothetical protein